MDFIGKHLEDANPSGVSERTHQNRMNQKREIIKKALELFAKNGYNNTTLEAIGSEMGMTRAALYRYFRSKNELLFLCHKVVFEYTMDKLNKRKSIQSPPARLARMLEDHILLYIEDFPSSMPILWSIKSFPPEYKKQIYEFRKKIEEPFMQCIEEWRKESPEQLKDIDNKVIINTFFSTANTVPRWWDGKSDPRLIAKQVVSILLDGIKRY